MTDNPVSARLLGRIKGGIGRLDQLIAGAAVRGIISMPDAYRHRPRNTGEVVRFDLESQLLSNFLSVHPSGLRQQDSELFAAIAAENIQLAQAVGEDHRDLPQNLVTQQVAELVVHALEVI